MKSGLMILGQLAETHRADVASLVRHLRWPVMADIQSGLRLGSPIADFLIPFEEAPIQPDAILHIGGRVVETTFFESLNRAALSHYIYVNDRLPDYDPFGLVTERRGPNINSACRQLIESPPSQLAHPDFIDKYVILSQAKDFFDKQELSESAVAYDISLLIPEGHGLFLSNSLPIRHMNRFAATDGAAVRVGTNRGASGIDGVLATATGFAAGLKRPVTLLIGDLALLHDLNSLHLAGRISQPLTIVVVNNRGGGLFHFLPIAKETDIFEPYFAAPHEFTFAKAAEMFGLDYQNPQNRQEFRSAYQKASRQKIPILIEVITSRHATFLEYGR